MDIEFIDENDENIILTVDRDDIDESARKGYVDYDTLMQQELQDTESEDEEESNTDANSDNGLEPKNKKTKKEKQSRWSFEHQKNLKKRNSANIVKERSGPRYEGRLVKTELEAFHLFFPYEMMDTIVERTNEQMEKTRTKISEELQEQQSQRFSDTNIDELYCFFGVLLFRGLYRDTKEPVEELWANDISCRAIYRASISYKRFQWLYRNITFHNHNTIRNDFMTDRFARMRWILNEFEKSARRYYRHTENTVIDETLRTFYATYNCDFKVYMKDKPGKYGLLFRVMADGKDRYASRILPYVTPPISGSWKKTSTHDLVMEMSKDILNTGRNVTGDRFYSAIDTAELLYKKNTTYVGTIMSNRKSLPTKFKSSKGRKPFTTEFAWKKDSPVMALSYCPKPNKSVLLISTQHESPDISPNSRNQKPEIIEFYNSQRCGVDIVNKMIRDYSCQPICNSWTMVVFTFLLDLGVINSKTILEYNTGNSITRRDYLRNLATALVLPYMKQRLDHPLKSSAQLAIETVLKSLGQFKEKPKAKEQEEQRKVTKCKMCIDELKGLKNEERRRRKGNLNYIKTHCDCCYLSVCPKHTAITSGGRGIVCFDCVEK